MGCLCITSKLSTTSVVALLSRPAKILTACSLCACTHLQCALIEGVAGELRQAWVHTVLHLRRQTHEPRCFACRHPLRQVTTSRRGACGFRPTLSGRRRSMLTQACSQWLLTQLHTDKPSHMHISRRTCSLMGFTPSSLSRSNRLWHRPASAERLHMMTGGSWQ